MTGLDMNQLHCVVVLDLCNGQQMEEPVGQELAGEDLKLKWDRLQSTAFMAVMELCCHHDAFLLGDRRGVHTSLAHVDVHATHSWWALGS